MRFLPMQFAKFMGVSILISLLGIVPSQASAEPNELRLYTNNPILAVVDGEPLILGDLKNSQIQDTMVQLYQMQSQVLKEKVLKKLVNNHPELKIDGKVPLPSQDDIVRFYKNTPGIKEMGTLKKMLVEIAEYLEKVFRNTYVDEKYQLAIKKGWAKVYLMPPLEFKLTANISSAKLWFEGEDKSPRRVFLLEYSDFQCPFCKRVQNTLGKLRDYYSKDVQFGYIHLPLDFHKEEKYE